MLEHKVVFINEQSVKKSKEVKVGDIIEIRYLEKSDKFQVLQIPTTKSTPKSKMEEYVKRIENV
jgi:ribosomal 50S subunit-recycling heat shock protein